MLCLSRKKGQTICIGDDIEVVILDNRRGQVKLGIAAPNDVKIDRLEIRQKKNYEQNYREVR